LSKAYETRDSLAVFFADSLGLSPAISLQFTLEVCTAAENRLKNTKTPYFGGLRSFKVIDVNTAKKLVANACYDKQHVCTYLQPFLHYTSQWRQKRRFKRVHLFDAFVQGELHPDSRNFVTIN